MTRDEPVVRCRVVACREVMADGNSWSLYVLNDSEVELESVVLDKLSYEWGDVGTDHEIGTRSGPLPPGAHALIHRDDGSGAELRMDVRITVQARGRACRMLFEFPRLYRMRDLPVVAALDKAGYAVSAEAGSA